MNRSHLGKAIFDLTVAETTHYLALKHVRDANSVVGRMFREARINIGITLRGAAKKLKVSPAFLSDVELGRRYANKKFRRKMMKIIL
jgi:ribosome-binding protein aMBF1 (putative translation factor)